MIPGRDLPIKIVDVFGSHRQIGRQVGEACREQVVKGIQVAREAIASFEGKSALTWDTAKMLSRKYLHFAESHYPKYVDELVGISEAAKVDFNEVLVANLLEELTDDQSHVQKCTSLAVNQERTVSRHVYLAHNEDWGKKDEEIIYLVSAHPDDEPSFLAVTYGALLPNVGFNAAGIAQGCDSVYPSDIRIGIPRLFVSRSVLGARSLREAIRSMQISQRAAGYNHLLVHESGEIYNIEVSALQVAYLYGRDGYLVHTNHYQDSIMRAIEVDPEELISSRIRCFRAERLINNTPLHTPESLQAILRDHVNRPYSICCHIDEEDTNDPVKTICSLVIDLTSRELLISWGSPCLNPYQRFSLKG